MSSDITSDQYEKGMLLADEFKNELDSWLTRRKKIIPLLNHVASELDEIQRKCDIAEVTGASVAAAGSLAIFGASVVTFFTGGAASPLLIGAATATATAGGTTVLVTKLINSLSSYIKKNDIDRWMKEDAEAIEKVEKRRDVLESYSRKTFGAEWICLACFLLSLRHINYITIYQITKYGKVTKKMELTIFDKIVDDIKYDLEYFGKTVTKMMVNNIIRTAIAAAATLVFSIVNIVETSKSIHGGSKSEVANNIRKIVEGFNKQLESAEKLLHAIKEAKENMVTVYKTALKDALDVITEREDQGVSASEYQLIETLAKDWLNSLIQVNGVSYDLHQLIDGLIALYKSTKEKFKSYKAHYKFMILAHGGIVNVGCSSSVYYGYGDIITNIRVFVPWGSLLDASAAAKILTGEASPDRMSFVKRNFFGRESQADVYRNSSGAVVRQVSSFNDFPKGGVTLPCINLTATYEDENVINVTKSYMANSSIRPDVILIPYFNSTNQRFFKYPDMPLFVVTSLLSLICHVRSTVSNTKVTCDIESVHCLEAGKGSGIDQNVPVAMAQYYSTVPSEKVEVHDKSFRSNEQSSVFQALKKLLS